MNICLIHDRHDKNNEIICFAGPGVFQLRIMTAPFHHVGFADFWLADQLNSLTTVLLDFEFLICFYALEVNWLGTSSKLSLSNNSSHTHTPTHTHTRAHTSTCTHYTPHTMHTLYTHYTQAVSCHLVIIHHTVTHTHTSTLAHYTHHTLCTHYTHTTHYTHKQ